MVTRLAHPHRQRRRAALIAEAVVALAILVTVMLPLAFAVMQETRLCRTYYYKSVALELVDGEMETLIAGEWRAFSQGRQRYDVTAAAATNLPPGEFFLTLEDRRVRLEWSPKTRNAGGVIAREALIR